MRKLIIICCLALVGNLHSQGLVESSQMMINDQQRAAAAVPIDLPMKAARSYFVDAIDEQYDIKVKGNGFLANRDVLSSEKVDIESLSPQTIDIYASFESISENSTLLKLSAREGYDLFYGKDYKPETFEKLKTVLDRVAEKTSMTYHQDLLEEQQDELKDIKKSKRSLVKSIDQNEDEINDNLKDNEKMTEENNEMRKELEELEQRLKKSQERIENVKGKLKKS